MVIALNEVADEKFWPRLIILAVVAVVITAAVYGVVGLIVKMDDIGLSLAQRTSKFTQRVGRGLVAAMPKLLSALSAIGTVAMLWVGGHICSSEPTTSAGTRRTAWSTTPRSSSITPSRASAGCWPGW